MDAHGLLYGLFGTIFNISGPNRAPNDVTLGDIPFYPVSDPNLKKSSRPQMSSRITPGRICLSLVAASTSIGCFVADWNETHVKNPKWPPHARFHNGQTMSMGLSLGLLTAYYTWRSSPSAIDSIRTATMVGCVYWITGLSAILYPGTKFVDPEFGEGAPQVPIFSGLIALALLGYWLEVRRLGGKKSI